MGVQRAVLALAVTELMTFWIMAELLMECCICPGIVSRGEKLVRLGQEL
jgi:hypothetical protein